MMVYEKCGGRGNILKEYEMGVKKTLVVRRAEFHEGQEERFFYFGGVGFTEMIEHSDLPQTRNFAVSF